MNNENIESSYEAKKYEDKIYKKWEESGAFEAKVDKKKEPFTISMPPPNATGTLHLGHAVMLALQDIMTRHQRMLGKSALWLPGTDHAAIATQSVVEKKLQEQGIKNPREELGRTKLLQEIRDFSENSKDIIRNQIRKMGASCDWNRERYTLDESMNKAVNTLFKYMYEDGLIYRSGRIVNWDPKMQTTVADDELEYKEKKGKFYYFQYGPVVIGTARPETKFLDKVIVVHPHDKRYKDLIGKEFDVEWIDGPIKAKVIADECIDMDLGTGAMTITPAHSVIDFDLAQKHNLDIEQIIGLDGKILHHISEEFGGMPISEARDKIVEKLDKKGLVVKIEEEYVHNVSTNYRGKGLVEPQVLKQWFIDVNKKVIDWHGKKRSIKEVLQSVLRDDMIEIVPERFEKTYYHWIDNLRDWCISRQIWWGHQIPIWYKATKEQYEAFNKSKDASSILLNALDLDETQLKFSETKPEGNYWIQDPDTLDTWFSSGLWTFSTLGWPQHTPEFKYFHPTSVLETGYDILFFWVARMILASTYALRKDGFSEEESLPFKTVYLHGLIHDRNGKKMSKSNPETCIDPLDMIEKYGADALRLSLVIGSTPGNDTRLYEEKIAGYRNFVNKIWNAARFALMNVSDEDLKTEFKPEMVKTIADKWILTKAQHLIKEVDSDMAKYRFSDAGTKIYDFIWNLYCDWYLEISKGENKNPAVLIHVLKTALKLLHPFTPFITEKLWEIIEPKTQLINEQWPEVDKKLIFKSEEGEMEIIHDTITQIRTARAELKVEPAKKIQAIIYGHKHTEILEMQKETIMRMARLESLEIQEKGEKVPDAKVIFIDKIEIYLPLKNFINAEKELIRINKEIEQKEKFIHSLEAKLKNPGFTSNAPAALIQEQKARLDSEKENVEKMKKQKLDLERLAK